MTNQDDRDIKDLFARAREADRTEAPAFGATRAARPGRPRRRLTPALAGGAGMALAAAAFATVILMPQFKNAPNERHYNRVVLDARPPEPTVAGEPATESVRASANAARELGEQIAPPAGPRTPTAQIPSKDAGSSGREKEDHFAYELEPKEGEAEEVVSGRGDPAVEAPAVVMKNASKDKVAGTFRLTSLGYVAAPGRVAPVSMLAPEESLSTESYQPIRETGFLSVTENPLSTFSIDVDTASYSLVRRFLTEGRLPPADAVRIEELVNYFPFHDPPPTGDEPFSVNVEVAGCPWAPVHRLARIGLRGRPVERTRRAGSNLVFLLDVSGSMDHPAKLPLLKSSLAMLVDQLDGGDQVAIVVYAGSSGLVLPPTSGADRSAIKEALERLRAGGSTNGGEGLQLAYRIAKERYVEGSVNRVVLATDGDFNVGITDRGELLRFVQQQARGGVALTVLGFGMGDYKDDMLEMLADNGDGNYAYIDGPLEARKVLVEQAGGTMVTIAKDVKIQVEFNPAEVGAYRLIGYENRMLRKEDFNDDRKDAGEIGAGHTVTALYEIVPPGAVVDLPGVDPLKYQTPPAASGAAAPGELLTVKLRYKEPGEGASRLISRSVVDEGLSFAAAPDDLRFAAAVAAFGMILRDSAHKGSASLEQVLEVAAGAARADEGGYRAEFLRLAETALRIASRGPREVEPTR